MFRNQSKRFWIILVACVAAFVFYFPSLVAFRYTAPPQNVTFLYQPWKSWSFAYTALTVPGDAKLKTSGEALRAAEKVWPGPQFDVGEVRVLFLDEGRPTPSRTTSSATRSRPRSRRPTTSSGRCAARSAATTPTP